MSKIIEALQKQATFVKEQSEKLKEAARLEQEARRLREEANRPVKLNLSVIRQAKEARRNKFIAAFAHNETEKNLIDKGWSQEDRKWINAEKPEWALELHGSEFTVYYKDSIFKEKVPLSHLDQFLKRPLAVTQTGLQAKEHLRRLKQLFNQ